MHVYQVIHHVQGEGDYTVGIYTTIESAREAMNAYRPTMIFSSFDYVKIMKVELNQKPRFEIFGIGERVH